MSRELAVSASTEGRPLTFSDEKEFVTMRVGDQLLGISVLAVGDVLKSQPLAKVPCAPKVVEGLLNIRGRIVTAINMRERLGLPPGQEEDAPSMNVVVEYHGELYSLIVDSVGDVHNLSMSQFEKPPANLAQQWREVAAGVFKLDSEILVILDVENVLGSLTTRE